MSYRAFLRACRAAIGVAALLAIPRLAQADPFALLAGVSGKVEVVSSRGGAGVRATFGRPLERGDRVVVGDAGSATIYFSDGNVIELGAKSSATIGGRVTSSARVGPGAGLPGSVYAQVSKFVTGGSRQNGLVALSAMRGDGGDKVALIVAPRRTDVLTDRPAFAWRAAEGATRYRVSVAGDQGEVWSREVTGLALAYPADTPALGRDADFLWKLEAFSDRGRLGSEEAAFHVMSEAMSGTVRADVERIGGSTGGADRPASHFLAGSYLFGRGLYQDAADHFTALCKQSPDSPAPHEALGNVYRAIGLMDLAAAEFQRALELTREP
jgi:hypothetical protein